MTKSDDKRKSVQQKDKSRTHQTATPRQIEKSLLIVQHEHPLDTLPFISDALLFMGNTLTQEPELGSYQRVETGAGLIIELLAYAIDDVQEAFEYQRKQAKDTST